MKIILSCNNFSYLSGSPLYCYTLAKEFTDLGHEMTIYAPYIGGVITQKAEEAGIKVVDKLPDEKFDVMHLNQKTSACLLNKYTCPAIYTIHSEFKVEEPLRDPRIKKYIVIRPTIATKWGVEAEVIYNPIDFTRFHPMPKPKKEMTLFVGTIDPLRKKSARVLMNMRANIRFVGQKFDNWADNQNWYPDTWDIEQHLEDATETAGIMLGRTTLEGWACGIPGIIFEVDETGDVVTVDKFDPPADMGLYDSKLVAKQYLKIYAELSREHS